MADQVTFGVKQSFGIFGSIGGLKKDVPVVLLSTVFTPDNENVLLKDTKIIRRKMREPDMLSANIDVGSVAINRSSIFETNYTVVDKSNPANNTGVITSIQIWASINMSGVIVATFSAIDNNLTAHDSYVIGSVTAGSVQTFAVDLGVTVGDYIGFYVLEGSIELSLDSGGSGCWYHIGDMTTTPSHAFTFDATYYAISLYGSSILSKCQTPDGNPIIHYHTFVKRSTGVEYLLAFTKAHIYHWNPSTKAFDVKFTCSSNCENWETANYNDKVIATNFLDKVLVWDTTGNFVALDNTTNGIEYETGVYLTKAKHLTVYENYLILGYTYENGNYYPQRMRWNAIGEETEWITGTSGSTEVGKSDVIKGFGEYQGLLIVFKKYSYYKYWLVATELVFNGSFISMEIGCLCSGSIVNDSKGRLYWYASDRTFKEFSVGTISGPIQTDIVDKIFQSSVEKIKSDFIDETEEVFWSIPVENALNNKVISFREGIWLQLNLAIPAFGSYHKP